MTDFDSSLNEVCEGVISEVLGSSGQSSASWWLARGGVSLSDCAQRPTEFDEALVELLRPAGALVIEARILSRLYRKIGARYIRGDSLSFRDEVEKARRLFEHTGESDQSSTR